GHAVAACALQRVGGSRRARGLFMALTVVAAKNGHGMASVMPTTRPQAWRWYNLRGDEAPDRGRHSAARAGNDLRRPLPCPAVFAAHGRLCRTAACGPP